MNVSNNNGSNSHLRPCQAESPAASAGQAICRHGAARLAGVVGVHAGGNAPAPAPTPAPAPPAMTPQPPTESCLRSATRPLRWGRQLLQRLFVAADLQPAAAATGHSNHVETANAPAAPSAPLSLPAGRSLNTRGYLERHDFGHLYLVQDVTPVSVLNHIAAQRGERRLLLQGSRHLPEIEGPIPQPEFDAGRRTLDGNIIGAYLTPEAARRAAEVRWGRRGQRLAMYALDARGLTGVSLGENRALNPGYAAMMVDDPFNVSHYVLVRDGAFVAAVGRSGFAPLRDLMVQVRLEGNMAPRMERIDDNVRLVAAALPGAA